MKIWELTVAINDYNQYGEYTFARFSEKPSLERLKEVCCKSSLDLPSPYSDGIPFEDVLTKLLRDGTVSEHPKGGGGNRWYLNEEEVF